MLKFSAQKTQKKVNNETYKSVKMVRFAKLPKSIEDVVVTMDPS